MFCFVLYLCCSWKDIVHKVNAQMDEEQVHGHPKSLHFDPKPGQEVLKGSPQPPSQKRGAQHEIAAQEGEKERTNDEELEMGIVSLILCYAALI